MRRSVHLRHVAVGLAAALVLLGVSRTSHAQGAVVHGSVAAATADGHTSPAFSGGVTWRFNDYVGVGVELGHLRSLATGVPHIWCCPGRDDSRATTFTTNVRLEIPTGSERVIPFVVGGGGVAAVTERYDVWYAGLGGNAMFTSEPQALGLSVMPILPGPPTVSTTSTNMALTLGGGASILLTEHVAVDADLRMLRILGDPTRTIGRFGVGASIRF